MSSTKDVKGTVIKDQNGSSSENSASISNEDNAVQERKSRALARQSPRIAELWNNNNRNRARSADSVILNHRNNPHLQHFMNRSQLQIQRYAGPPMLPHQSHGNQPQQQQQQFFNPLGCLNVGMADLPSSQMTAGTPGDQCSSFLQLLGDNPTIGNQGENCQEAMLMSGSGGGNKQGDMMKSSQDPAVSHLSVNAGQCQMKEPTQYLNGSLAMPQSVGTKSAGVNTGPSNPITTTTMAKTALVTTTAITTMIMHTSDSAHTVTSASTLTTTTGVMYHNPKPESGEKRKTTDDQEDRSDKKRLNLENELPNELMVKMYEELLGMKSVVNGMNSKINEVNEKVENIQSENNEWKQKVLQIEVEVSELKESVEMAHNLVSDETKNRKQENTELRGNLMDRAKELGNVGQIVRRHSGEIKGVQDNVAKVDVKLSKLEEEQKRMVGQHLESTEEFPVAKTIVAQSVWCREGEDVMAIAKTIINKALQLTELEVIRAIRKSGQPGGNGLIKIELKEKEDVKVVLANKRKLRDNPTAEIRDVYLRQSKREETLIMERNIDMVLTDMGVREDYVRVASGYLVRKSEMKNHGTGGCGGRGTRGRGGSRGGCGRGSYSNSTRRAGPVTGTEDPNDERVAQREAREERKSRSKPEMSIDEYMS